MTDKVQKIKEWISKEQDGLMDAQGNFEYPEHEGAYHILCNLDTYIDSLQEESPCEDLENAATKYAQDKYMPVQTSQAFKAGAEWGKNQAEIQIKAQSMALAHGCPKESVSEDLEKIVEEIAEPTILNAYGTKELARRLRNTICGTSVSEDLNEAVTRIIKETSKIPNLSEYEALYHCAVEGAQWQKEQDKQ